MTAVPVSVESTTPAPVAQIDWLKTRSDYVAVNAGRRAHCPGFVLLGRDRGDSAPPRVGITASRKVGNAVTRNRAKRRLRALAREVVPVAGQRGWDYVLIARAGETVSRGFSELASDLRRTLAGLHGSRA